MMELLPRRQRRISCERVWLFTELLLFIGAFAALPLFGQQDRGTILGTVFDGSGAAIPNAKVVVQNQGTGSRRELSTDGSGLFVAPELPVGTYRVSASVEGFKTRVQSDINLRVSDRMKVDLTLDPGDVTETVTVTGENPLVETASNTLGGTITQAEVEKLPLNGRDPNYLLALIPGVNLRGNMFQQSMNGLNTGGQSVSLVTFMMDGVDASRVDAQTITITYGRSRNRIARVNAEGIEEFKMYQNSFSAEFGGSTGSVVNIVTRSGTNAFHGSLFEFLRNEKLDAREFFNKPPARKPAFRLNQFGGSVGGPIVRDRAFFFFSYEGIRQSTGTSLVGLVPTQEYRSTLPAELNEVVDQLPLPNGAPSADPRIGFYNFAGSGLLNENSFFTRMDYNITEKDRLSGRYNANDSLTETIFGVAQGQTGPSPGLLQNAKLTYTRSFSPTLLNEASIGYNRMHIDPRGAIDEATRNFPVVSVGGMSSVGPALFDLSMVGNSYTYLDTLSWVKSRHQLKFGLAITRNQQNKALFFQRTVSYPNLNDFAINSPSSVGLLGYPRTGIRNTYYSYFIQDDFQATQKLTLNIGLRYQFDSSPADVNDRQSNFDPATGLVDTPGTQLLNMPTKNFGPRFGFAYSPFGSGNTVIRGAYGIYHATFNATIAQNTPTNTNPTSVSLSRQQKPDLVGFPFPDISSFSGVQGISAIQRNWNSPYVQNWNLNIQQALGRDMRFQIGYVANKGTHIVTPGQNLNRFFPFTSTRPYPTFGDINYMRSNGISNYNSLQATLVKRFSNGAQFNVNYTYGHALDNSPPVFSANSDDTNVNLDYGTTESDVTHLLSFGYSYEIPALGRVPAWLGSGWQINGLSEMRTGLPINVMCGCDPLGKNQFTSRADFRVDGGPAQPSPVIVPDRQLNIGAFVAPPSGRIGNVARGAFRGPAVFNWDFSLFKKFRVREGHELQFRAEMFNIFNTPQFNLPGSSINSAANFGVSTSTLATVSNFGTQRQVQFGLRYNF